MSPVKLQSAKFRWATPSRIESDDEGAAAARELQLDFLYIYISIYINVH